MTKTNFFWLYFILFGINLVITGTANAVNFRTLPRGIIPVSRAGCTASIQSISTSTPWAAVGAIAPSPSIPSPVTPTGQLNLIPGIAINNVNFGAISTNSNCPTTLTFQSTSHYVLTSGAKNLAYILTASGPFGVVNVTQSPQNIILTVTGPVLTTLGISIPVVPSTVGTGLYTDSITVSYSIN